MARRTARAVGGQGDRRFEHLGERPELVREHELLNLAGDGTIELAISDAILDEFSRILHDTLEWSDDRLNRMRVEDATFTKRVSSTETLDVVKADPGDNRILECAVAAGSDVIACCIST